MSTRFTVEIARALLQKLSTDDNFRAAFQANPRASVSVLMTLNETSYAPGEGAMTDHPIAWYHEFEGGRAWYTALGHRQELYQDPRFTQHLLGGIRWVAGVAP